MGGYLKKKILSYLPFWEVDLESIFYDVWKLKFANVANLLLATL